jgi:hypothetical protein
LGRGLLQAQRFNRREVGFFLRPRQHVDAHGILVARNLDLAHRIGPAPVVLLPVLEQQRQRVQIMP